MTIHIQLDFLYRIVKIFFRMTGLVGIAKIFSMFDVRGNVKGVCCGCCRMDVSGSGIERTTQLKT